MPPRRRNPTYMQPTNDGAARRLARVLALSSEAAKEIAASRTGKRARADETTQLATELSKVLASQKKRGKTEI